MTPDFDELIVEDLTRHFGRRRALSHLWFRVPAGSIFGLLGPNGAGKSTLLAVLATLLRPTSGRVQYGQLGAVDSGQGVVAPARGAALRARIGVLGHELYLYPDLTARENLVFFAALHGVAEPPAVAMRALSRADLGDRADDPVSSFSRGMRQRVALERALIHDPRLLLLDEPFTGLDTRSVAALTARLRERRAAGTIVVAATHDLDLAEGLFDEAVVMREGRIWDTVTRPQDLQSVYHAIMSRGHQ